MGWPISAIMANPHAAGAHAAGHPTFESIYWRFLGRMTDQEIDLLAPFVEPRSLAAGEVFCDLDSAPPGVLFIGGGFVSIETRMPSGLMSMPAIMGRGRIFGEGAFTALDPTVRAVPMQISAVRPATVWVLPTGKVAAAIQAVPPFERALRRAIAVRGATATFAEMLRQTIILSGAPVPMLNALVTGADLEEFAAGKTILKSGEKSRGVFMLIEGTASCFTKHEHGESKGTLREGMIFGGLRHTLAVEPESVTAIEKCVCLRIGTRQMADAIATSPALRRVAGNLEVFASTAASRASFVMVMGNKRYPLSQLAFLAAAELTQSYNDECALVSLKKEGSKLADPVDRDGVHCIEIGISSGTAQQRVADLRKRLGHLEFIFVDPGDLPIHEIAAVGSHLSRIAMVVDDTFVDPPANWRSDRIAWAVQLPDVVPPGDPPYQPGTVRFNLDMNAIRRVKSIKDVSTPDRLRLQRWVRSLSDRTVGVALGGGGAWGFAHVELLDMLARKGVPVDVVSGASFGSLLGAFYCGLHGMEGKAGPLWREALYDVAPAATVATKTAFFTSKTLERVIDKYIAKYAGRVLNLEDLEVPLLPVATNVGLGAEAVIRRGTIGYGSRCSSSFPGIFTPTTGPGVRYVDGGIVRNVPTDPLVLHGCDLVIASNIVPNPNYERERDPRFPGAVGRWLHEFNLVRRAEDTLRSSLILMHAASGASAWNADITYNSPFVNFSPTNMNNGEEIRKAAIPSVKAIEDRVFNAWERLKQGRAE